MQEFKGFKGFGVRTVWGSGIWGFGVGSLGFSVWGLWFRAWVWGLLQNPEDPKPAALELSGA